MRIITIRHGAYQESFDQQGRKLVHTPESMLDDLGKDQMKKLSDLFQQKGISFDVIFTSPLKRAKESATIISKGMDVADVIDIDGVADVFPNSANGKPWAKLEEVNGDIYNNPIDGDPQESLSELVERVRSAMQSIVKLAKEKNCQTLGVVSHGDTLSAIDWVLKDSENPTSYEEMKQAFYLQKGEAWGYLSEGELFSSQAVQGSVERVQE